MSNKNAERNFHSPQAISVEEDEGQKPIAVTLKGKILAVVSVDEMWEEEVSESEWLEATTLEYYRVTLEDLQQLTLLRHMRLESWYWTG